jgi:hypothetical protein
MDRVEWCAAAGLAVLAATMWGLIVWFGGAPADHVLWVRDARWAAIVLATCAMVCTTTARTWSAATLALAAGWLLADRWIASSGTGTPAAGIVVFVAVVGWTLLAAGLGRAIPATRGQGSITTPMAVGLVAAFASPALLLSAASAPDASPPPVVLVMATACLPPGLATAALLGGLRARSARGATPLGQRRLSVRAGIALIGIVVAAAAVTATDWAAIALPLGGVIAWFSLAMAVVGRRRPGPRMSSRAAAGISLGGLLAICGAVLTYTLAAVTRPLVVYLAPGGGHTGMAAVPAALAVGLLAAALLRRVAKAPMR